MIYKLMESKMAMDDNTVLMANPVVVFREEFEDFAVLFDPDSGEGYGLNPVGVLIWKLLDGNRSVREIKKEIRQNFRDVDKDAGNHIDEFIEELVERGLAGHKI